MNSRTHACLECGKPVSARRSTQHFCSQQCRLAFNNRRLQRGAQLYDLFMSMRYERDKAAELGLWAIMCRMAKDMREEDENQRDGRKSWQPALAVLDRLPVVMTSKNVTIMRDLTGRARR